MQKVVCHCLNDADEIKFTPTRDSIWKLLQVTVPELVNRFTAFSDGQNHKSAIIRYLNEKRQNQMLLPCCRTYHTKKIYIHANNKTFQGDLKTGRPFLPEMTVKSATGLCTYSCWTVPFGMFGKLCNQNVLRLLGADDVIVELLVDVGRGLGTWEMQVFILD